MLEVFTLVETQRGKQALAKLASIRLLRKWLAVRNALTYNPAVLLTAAICSAGPSGGQNKIRTFFFKLDLRKF
jgi:hypothetical protein